MNELNDISENIIKLRGELFNFSNKFSDIDNKLSVHIEKLYDYKDRLTDDNDRKLIDETIKILEDEKNEHIIFMNEIKAGFEELSSLMSFDSSENNCIVYKPIGLRILEAQEEERRRIARELHDSTVQNLTGLVYKTEICSKVIDRDSTRVKLELQIILKSLKDIIKEVRSTIYNLKPTLVMDKSFDSRVEKYLNNMGISYPNTTFVYHKEGDSKQINCIYCSTLLKIIQEACQNAVKHSNANIIQVNLVYLPDSLKVRIEDNGGGFDLQTDGKTSGQLEHFGLSIMKERAQLLGSNLMIRSSINEGTIVELDVSRVYDSKGDNNESN